MDPLDLLLVEDNPGDAELLAEALGRSSSPWRITLLRDGGETVDYLLRRGRHLRAPRPNLTVLDDNLPLGNAAEVLQELRAEGALGDLPVLLVSGSPLDPGRRAALGLRDEDCIVKPSTFQGYLDLARLLEARARRAP